MSTKLETIVIETKNKPEFAVIWLHGLGADGNDFVPIVEAMGLEESAAIRFIFPHAPIRPITINGGMTMRGWYDITETSLDQRQDVAGIKESANLIVELINGQIESGINQQKIFLAGFSQGGALALYTGLSSSFSLAGIIALSAYVPIADELEIIQRPAIFYAHGKYDPVIPMSLAKRSHEWLLSNNIVPAWHSYEMQHQVVMDEILEIKRWLLSRINDIQTNE